MERTDLAMKEQGQIQALRTKIQKIVEQLRTEERVRRRNSKYRWRPRPRLA